MALIVEQIGPSGSGKTTVYAAVTRLAVAGASWAPAEAFFGGVPRCRLGDPEGGPAPLPTPFDDDGLDRAGDRFLEQNPAFAAFLWEQITDAYRSDARGVDIRLSVVGGAYIGMAQFQAVSESGDPRICFLDEGLTHNAYLGNWPTMDVVGQYVSLLPRLPSAAVRLMAPVEAIVERIKGRPERVFYHRGRSDDELAEIVRMSSASTARMAEQLARRDVVVLEVDALRDAAVNAAAIVSFLESL